jgi:PAS domain S-box-containing protein
MPPDFDKRPLDKISDAKGALGTGADKFPTEPSREQLVTELQQKNAELAVRNEELLLSQQILSLTSTALETAANAVMITNFKGTILWVNPAFVALTGYTSEEVVGKTPRLLKSGKHDREFYKTLWETILAGKTWRGSFTNRRKDGSLYYDEHTITPVRSDDGSITRFIAIMNDVTERRQAEAALKKSEGRFRLLVEQAVDAFFLHDGDGKFLEVNPRACESLGYSKEELLNMSVSDVTSLSEEEAKSIGDQLQAGSTLTVNDHHRRKDGTRFPVEVRLGSFDADGQKLFLALARDISDREKAEEVLRGVSSQESGRHQRRVLRDLAIIGILSAMVFLIGDLIHDIVNPIFLSLAFENGQISRNLDEAFASMAFFCLAMLVFSYRRWKESRKDMLSQTQVSKALGILHKEMGVQVRQRTAQLLQTNEDLRAEIVERRRAEAIINRFAAIIESSDDAIISKTLDGIVTSWNPASEKMFGYTASEIIGKPITLLFPPDRVQEEGEILARIAGGEPVRHFETIRVRKDGRQLDVSVTLSPIRDADGKITGVSKIVRDITERKQAQETIDRLNRQRELVLDASGEGIMGMDPQGNHTFVNRAAANMLGYEPEELLGRHSHTMWHHTKTDGSPYPAQECPNYAVFRDGVGRSVTGEVFWKKDGTSFPVEYESTPIREGDQVVGVVVTFKDVTERQRAEGALRESEAKFRALFDAANDAILILHNNVFVDCNASALELYGVTRDQLIGQSPSRFSPPTQPDGRDSQEKAMEINQRALGGEPQFFEWAHQRPDGTAVDAEVSLSRFELHGEPYLQAIVRDITERQQMENALRSAEAKFRSLVEQSLFGIYIIQDNRFTYVNPRFAQIFGYEQDEIVKVKSILDLVSDEDRARVTDNLQKRLLGEVQVVQYSFRARRKDGTPIYVEVHGTRADLNGQPAVIGALLDITERKRAEEQISEQAAFLDKARDAIIVRDLEGKILYWNKGAERIYGWTREEVVGRNVFEILRPDPKKFEELNRLTISHGEWNGELQHLTRDRREITSEVRITLIRDNEGHPKSILAINTDITEKKKIEAQFMRAQRMESIGMLAGGIAHDLNNILAPIMMSIDILKTSSDSPETKQILDTIELSAKRGADIVRQVLSFARGVEGERIEVQPKHLLKDLENIIKDTFPKDIRLQFSIPNDMWTILGDPTQVHQVLLNLCVNARDAMPHGGSLTIEVENCVLDEQYAAMNLQAKAGRYVNISVTDSGTGIPPGILDKIFEPFFTTKELHKGTGLGLSTVMAIVKSHEGIINVYSEPGKGTIFKVYLPAMELSSEALKKQTQLVSPPRGNGETVLVVDDEASILTITSETLQAFGYRVLTATDGAEAVAVYSDHENEIAVVLTDMMMPIMDGTAAIHALRQINPAIKVVASSGLGSVDGEANASGVSVKHFLMKPYTAATLLKTMRAILNEA